MSGLSEPSFIPFAQNETGGAITVYVFAVLSAFALFSIISRIAWLAMQRFWTRGAVEPREYVFFHTQLGNYAACLLIANLFTSTSGLIGIRWAMERGITEGSACRAQALVMQIGNWGQAYFTVTIAVHTFNSLVLRRKQSIMISATAISIGWILSILLAATPFLMKQPEGFVYGANGFTCGVRRIYPRAQFMFHLLPILVASILSALLYSVIFLALRGTLMIRGGLKITLDPNERWNDSEGVNYHRFIARIAKSMLWYPVAYIVLLVPYSIMRLLDISGFFVPFQAMVFAYACWFMLGVVNVLLLYNTFRVLGPAFDARSTVASRKSRDMESFGTTEKFGDNALNPEERAAWEEKVKQYRFPVPTYRPTSEAPSEMSGSSSARHLLPLQHDRSASEQSTFSFTNAGSIGRSITPTPSRDQALSSPEPAMMKVNTRPALGLHIREDSSTSLPAPPRRTRSPILTKPSYESLSPASRGDGMWEMVSSPVVPPKQPLRTLQLVDQGQGEQSARSWNSEELDTPSWVVRRPVDVTRDANGQPLVSAMAPSFPMPPTPSPPREPSLLSRSLSALSRASSTAAPVSRQRPLLIAVQGIERTASYGYTPSSVTATRSYF